MSLRVRFRGRINEVATTTVLYHREYIARRSADEWEGRLSAGLLRVLEGETCADVRAALLELASDATEWIAAIDAETRFVGRK